MGISQLWEKYSKNKTNELRNLLVIEYLGLVKRQITNLPVPQGMDLDDLRQLGIFGLMKAIEKYNPNKGAKFETYASWKIRGAILDEYRVQGQITKGLSRTISEKRKRIENQTLKLEQSLQRQPTSKEIAESLGITLEEYYKMLGEISLSTAISLDDLVGSEENLSLEQVIKNEKAIDPMEEFMQNERIILLMNVIDELPDNLKTIIGLYYDREMTFKEIGKAIGLSEARISQLHTEAVLRIRAKVNLEQ